MCGVILNTPDVLMGCPVVDAFVDVVTYISWWRVVAEDIVCPLINLLVVAMIGLMGLTTLMSVSIMAVVMCLLIVVTIVIPLVCITWGNGCNESHQEVVRCGFGGYD